MKKKIMAVLLALAMVTQGAMPVFAQNEGEEGIETAADAETVLVPIPGTEDERICEARQVHKRCFDLVSEMLEKVK